MSRGPLQLGLAAALLAVAAIAASGALAQAPQAIPPFEARVMDLTGTLSAAQQAALESKLAEFEARKGAQVAVLIVPTTQPEEIEQYSIRLVEAWKLGRAKPDDGALLLVAKEDRRMRIEVGRGLEGALTDLASKRIIADVITPLFKQGDFAGGIDAGTDQMIRVIDGEPLPEPDQRWSGRGSALADLLPFLFFAVLVGSVVLRSIFGRALGSVATGGVTGYVAYAITSALGIAAGAGIAAFVFSLVLGSLGGGLWSSIPRHGGWRGGGWGSGGGGFGGGGFGGGGGGFGGGGGGSFGGGGASGGW